MLVDSGSRVQRILGAAVPATYHFGPISTLARTKRATSASSTAGRATPRSVNAATVRAHGQGPLASAKPVAGKNAASAASRDDGAATSAERKRSYGAGRAAMPAATSARPRRA